MKNKNKQVKGEKIRQEPLKSARSPGTNGQEIQDEFSLDDLPSQIAQALQCPEVKELMTKKMGHDSGADPQPLLPVRRLHNFLYCPRLFYYQWVEGVFLENADTVEGSSIHRAVDEPSRIKDQGKVEVPEGKKLRSLHLSSEKLGITGMIDIIEGNENGVEIIDYKKGSARRDQNGDLIPKEPDAMQVCAYALLLHEQGQIVSSASIYYAADRKKVAVNISSENLDLCIRKIAEAKAAGASGHCPPPLQNDSRCLYCSAYPICLPNESSWWAHPDETPPKIKDAPRPPGDQGEILVVQKPGTTVGQRGGEFVVSEKKEVLAKFPVRQLQSLYLYGAVQVTAQAAQTCLEENINVAYFSPAGRFLGMLQGLPASGIDARMGQYRMFGEPGIRLRLAQEIVRAKIHNQRVLLMRNADVGDATLRRLSDLRDRSSEVADMSELLGIEGAAAAVYFENFSKMLSDKARLSFDFTLRNRRPPRDPVNALLSMGYSILAKELTGVCHAVGLDPFLGFYHQPRYGRPALALDLMEEFRPLIADSVVISVLNRGEIVESDFISSASGVFLNEKGRRPFWEAWFRRMDTEITHPQFGYTMSYRRMFEVQARQIWRFVQGEAEKYHGLTTR